MHVHIKIRRHAGRKKKEGDGQAFVSGKKEYEKGFSYDIVRKIQKIVCRTAMKKMPTSENQIQNSRIQ